MSPTLRAPPQKPEIAQLERPWRRWEGMLLAMFAVALLLAGVAPAMPWGDAVPVLLLAYSPRVVVAAAALGALAFTLRPVFLGEGGATRTRRWRTAGTLIVAAGFALGDLGWGGHTLVQARSDRDPLITLLSFNVHDAVDELEALARICEDFDVDVLTLQEVKPTSREAFLSGLPDYAFVWGDETARFEHDDWGPFSSMIGVRRRHLAVGGISENVAHGPDGLARHLRVDTAITGYRTFAARVPVMGSWLWVVNVHGTKAFWTADGVRGLVEHAASKKAWHVGERVNLRAWLNTHDDVPVVVAGDFNAPHYAPAVDGLGLHQAHTDVGHGAHISFPRAFPIWGIDHVLGNLGVRFEEYVLFDAGFSDHRAQLVRLHASSPSPRSPAVPN